MRPSNYVLIRSDLDLTQEFLNSFVSELKLKPFLDVTHSAHQVFSAALSQVSASLKSFYQTVFFSSNSSALPGPTSSTSNPTPSSHSRSPSTAAPDLSSPFHDPSLSSLPSSSSVQQLYYKGQEGLYQFLIDLSPILNQTSPFSTSSLIKIVLSDTNFFSPFRDRTTSRAHITQSQGPFSVSTSVKRKEV